MAEQVSGSLTKAINSEVGMAFARGVMVFAGVILLPALTLLGYLVHDWVTGPVNALAARVSIVEAILPEIHQDELKIGVMQNSMDLGRADRLSATDDMKQGLSALNAKTDQLQSTVSSMSSTLAGISATLDDMKAHNVAALTRP